MTVGRAWGIDAIRVSQEQAFDPYFMPTGQGVALYSKYHGNSFLAMTGKNIPAYKQPFRMNTLEASDKVAIIDAVATENSSNIYFHVINRHFSKDISVSIDLSAFSGVSSTAIHRKFKSLYLNRIFWNGPGIGYFTNTKFNFNDKKAEIILPRRSVSIIQFDK